MNQKLILVCEKDTLYWYIEMKMHYKLIQTKLNNVFY